MSLSVDGVWEAGVWSTSIWADGVWREGSATASPTTSPGIGFHISRIGMMNVLLTIGMMTWV